MDQFVDEVSPPEGEDLIMRNTRELLAINPLNIEMSKKIHVIERLPIVRAKRLGLFFLQRSSGPARRYYPRGLDGPP